MKYEKNYKKIRSLISESAQSSNSRVYRDTYMYMALQCYMLHNQIAIDEWHNADFRASVDLPHTLIGWSLCLVSYSTLPE